MSGVESVLMKLRSDNEEEKECGCKTLASLTGEPGAAQIFLSGGAVRLLCSMLVGTGPELLRAALGALRNLSIDGGVEACELMVQHEIMTPLLTTLQTLLEVERVPSVDVHPTAALLEAFYLLTSLCEASETAVKLVSKHVELLLAVLANRVDHITLCLAAAECLYVMSDNNAEMTLELSAPSHRDTLTRALACPLRGALTTQPASAGSVGERMLLRTFVAGIVDTSKDNLRSDPVLLDSLALTLCETLSLETPKILARIALELEHLPAAQQESGAGASAEPIDSWVVEFRELDAQIHIAETVLKAQRIASELIANLVAGDGSESWEDCSTSEGGEEGEEKCVEEVEEVSMEACSMEDDSESTDTSSMSPIYAALVGYGVISRMFSLASRSDQWCESCQDRPHVRNLINSYNRCRVTALLCVGNIIEMAPADVIGDADTLFDHWRRLSAMTSSQSVLADIDLLEAVTSALRAVACRLNKDGSSRLSEVSADDLRLMSELTLGCSHAGVRTNIVRTVCAAGCSVARTTPSSTLLSDILRFLYGVAESDAVLPVIAEALDSIFDVFSGDDSDQILREFGLVAKLRALAPVVKQKLRQQKKQLGQHKVLVASACDVLRQFIEYKSQRGVQ